MKSLFWLLTYGLGLVYFDFFIIRRNNSKVSVIDSIETTYDVLKNKKKKVLKRYKKKRKFNKNITRKIVNRNYLSSKPKSNRFLNQKTLRRMYRND